MVVYAFAGTVIAVVVDSRDEASAAMDGVVVDANGIDGGVVGGVAGGVAVAGDAGDGDGDVAVVADFVDDAAAVGFVGVG